MMQLKPLSPAAIPRALEKAERYRLLNEPLEAESICRDILDVDPDHREAQVNLVLALTDQLAVGRCDRLGDAEAAAEQLAGEYDRAYYRGIVCERHAKSLFRRGTPGAASMTYEWLTKAMRWYEEAERLRPQDNEDALLRWNACARILMRHPQLRPAEALASPLELE